MRKNLIALIATFIFSHHVIAQKLQFIYIKHQADNNPVRETLIGNKLRFKLNSYNMFFDKNEQSKFLIHIAVFSDSIGNFTKEKISASNIIDLNIIPEQNLFAMAKQNVRKDQEREISYFEYDATNYQHYPIISNNFKIIAEENDGSLWLYHNPTAVFFYEIRAYKQFTPVQSCASLINLQSIQQPMERHNEEYHEENYVVNNVKSDDNLDFYLSNKLFLEKKNNDSSFHFVKFRIHCFDCGENDFEFDYDDNIGIKRLWYYIPKKLSGKRAYVKFE